MSEKRFFFLHVMKTGGGTLRRQIFANFSEDEVYPSASFDGNMLEANTSLHRLLNPGRRRSPIRVFAGHFPYAAIQLLGGNFTTITILRDPVERTLSLLKQFKSQHESLRTAPLEDIYERPLIFIPYIKNHQAKLFALTADDKPDSYHQALDVDEQRLEAAKRNLERIDVVGTHEHYEQLLSELRLRFGWQFPAIADRNVTHKEEVSATFRRRIAEDNAADVEFFRYASQLRDRRRARPARIDG